MARISTYPIVSIPTLNDLLIGTDVENLNETKNFSLGDISGLIGQGFVPYVGATGNVNLGAFNITAASFIIPGGLASQFVKADGSLDSTVYVPQTRTLTINGVTYNLSANRSWDLNTVDTLTTTGTSGAATYIGKTLNIPQYQAQGAYITQLSGEATAVGPGNATVTLDNAAVTGKVLTGLNVIGGTVVSTDTILQAFGKVQNQINGLAGGVEYQGVWNAATNTPFLQSSVGVQGYYYVVNVAGTTNLNGITDWQVGDWAIFNGSTWDKVDNTDAVVSVNGYVGAVVLTASDVGAVPTTRTLTINGVGYDLSADRAWTVGDVRTDQTYANPSWITSLAWTKITGTPTTLAGYGITDGALNTTTLTINGVTFDLTANRTWNVGTVTSIATTGPITGGTITGSGTIGITQAGASSDGYLSSTDWNTFNSKQAAISVTAPLTFVAGVVGITQSGALTDGYLSSVDWNTFNSKVSGSGTPNTLPMWGSSTSLVNSPLSYAADTFNFHYNSATGGTVVFTNSNGTAYAYTIQMNNFGSPRSTIHGYTDGLVIQSIGGTQVSRMFANGNMILGTGTVETGHKLTISGDLFVNTIINAVLDTDRFIVSDGGIIKYRTGAEVLADIGAQGSLTLTTTGTSGASTLIGNTLNIPQYTDQFVGTVTSVGLSMPSAFNVSNSPITSSGTIAVTAAGTASQYVRGDGTLADFPSGGGGGGSSVSYYLNGSVNQGTFVGNNYYEMSKTPVFGAGTDFVAIADGYVAQFITDAGDPNSLIIPAGNWNFETYFSASSAGGTPSFYVELYKYDGSTFTLIASNSTNPELIAFGTTVNPYFSALAVPETILTVTDRIAIRIYVVTSGRTITLHTENSNLCQIVTTFTRGLTALNGLTAQVQYFQVGTSGTDFNIASSVATHTFNLPTASAVNRGALSSADWSTFNSKQNTITLTTTGTSGPATFIGDVLNVPNYTTDLSGYVTLATNQTITGLKTILRSGDVLNFKIGTDTLYGLKVAYNQNELAPSGEATWSFVNTFNNGSGTGLDTTPISFFRGVLVTGQRLVSASVNTNLLDYYGNNPSGRYPIYAYNTGVQQFASSIIVGETTGVVDAITGAISDLPAGVVANFKGRVIGSNAVNSNEFATLGQVTSTSRAAISLTTTGTSGPATYSSVTGVLNIPEYQGGVTSFNTRTGAVTLTSSDVTTALGYTPVTDARTLTINGVTYDLTANRSWTVDVNPSAREIQTYIATASQTTFTVTGGYTVGLVDVFINGVRLTSSDYTATNGTTVVLTVGTMAGNIVDIIKYTSGFTNPIAGTLATGQVAFGTAANTVGGSSNLIFDSTNINLGIGVATAASIDPTITSVVIRDAGSKVLGSKTGVLAFQTSDASFTGTYTDAVTAEIYSVSENSVGSEFAIGFLTSTISGTNRAERWRIRAGGTFESNGAQTIQTSTGNLTLATAAGNGNIVLSPNGTGYLDVKSFIQIDNYAAGTTVPNTAGVLRILSGSKTGWAPNDELGKIEFFGTDTSGIGPRNLASIRAVNSTGNGTTTTTSNGELAFYTSAPNALESEKWRIRDTGVLQSSGAQTIQTSTGNLTLATAGGNGNVVLSPNGTGVVTTNNSVGIGTTSLTQYSLRVSKNITGAVSSFGITSDGIIQSDATSNGFYYNTIASTATVSFTVGNIVHYFASQGTFGAGSTVNNQYGFFAAATIIGATNDYGFYGDIASGANRWNLYMNGTANNYLAGNLLLNTTTDAGFRLDVNGTARVSSSLTAASATFSQSAGNTLQVYQTSPTNSTTAIIRQTGQGGNGSQDIGLVVDIQAAGNQDRIVNFRYFDGTNYNSRFLVRRDGNVGIGTASPQSNGNFIHVDIVGKDTSSGGSLWVSNSDKTTRGVIYNTNSAVYAGSATSHDYILITNNTERVRITNSGNLLVGTTTDNGAMLQVSGTATVSSNIAIGGTITSLSDTDELSIFAGTTIVDNRARIELYGPSHATFANQTFVRGSQIVFTSSAAATEYMRFASTGAATFSSSVTASGQITGPSGGTEGKFNFIGYNNAYGGITANTGFNTNYNAVSIYSNFNSTRNGQGNTSNPSWILDLGGSIPDSDSFGIFRSPAGSFTFSNLFKVTSGGNVLIGTTTDGGRKLEIQTGSTNAALWVQTGGTTSAYTIADFRTGTNLPALQILGNGDSTFGGKAFAGGFTSRTGTVSIASGATATITNMDVNGVFLVNIQVNGGSLIFNATNYFIANNTNGQYVNAGALYDGANVTLSNSGSAIQITNNGFSTLLWHWSVFIMPYAAI